MDRKVAIVTGGGSGIGRAIAEAFAENGIAPVIADFDEGAADIAHALNGHFIHADLSKRVACRRVVDETLEKYGQVDILINNAGVQNVHRVHEFPEDTWDMMIALMLTAPFLLTKYVWESMMAQKWGRIVNMGSIHSLVASPAKAAYISAKHGLIGLTKTTALEGGAYGITVNAICPAYVRTPLVDGQITAQAQDRGISEEDVVQDVMLANAAIKQMIDPSEIADLVLYLCSDKARSVTGASWTIDLGWTAR